ncbi:hypothetical protein ACT3UJ_00675 [Halomonas sp. 86]|uniref:hypothetical protein n=1 Tax=unclassified Halomonas TaxID=2609666 RepID=UPI0040333BDC
MAALTCLALAISRCLMRAPLAFEQDMIVVAVDYRLGLPSAQALVSHDDAFLEKPCPDR